MGVHRCVEAAEVLSKKGIEAEVLDLRWVAPLDKQKLVETARKTGKIVVVDEDYMQFGLSGEIAGILNENDLAFRYRRVCTEETIPFSRELEDQVLPGVGRILEAAGEILK